MKCSNSIMKRKYFLVAKLKLFMELSGTEDAFYIRCAWYSGMQPDQLIVALD